MMLFKLLGAHLQPYRSQIAAIVGLQFLAVVASLFLPSLNADIIDKGVATRRHRLHLAAAARSCSASPLRPDRRPDRGDLVRRARRRWAFGRDLRGGDLRPGAGVLRARDATSSARRSLITRNTNDVQQVQMLVLMTRDHDRQRPDHDGRRRLHGAARGRRAQSG